MVRYSFECSVLCIAHLLEEEYMVCDVQLFIWKSRAKSRSCVDCSFVNKLDTKCETAACYSMLHIIVWFQTKVTPTLPQLVQ